MKKVKYFYSSKTQRFEPYKLPLWKKMLQVLGLISAVFVAAGIIVSIAFKYIGSPKEKQLMKQMDLLEEKYALLKNEIKNNNQKINDLAERDNIIYREIFEADPLPDSIRLGYEKINEKDWQKNLSPFSNQELLIAIEKTISQQKNKIKQQQKSYDTLEKLISNKSEMLASIPSIQPVSNKQLNRIASGFGFRIDPIYKIGKFHAGLDFSAPAGTPIYATGNGIVDESSYSSSGYGNNVWINHSFGYRTHYAHMIKLNCKTGQKIKRGQVIGWVGSTGKSTGPHLHYEISYKGKKVDPVHFFFQDIKTEDFERMVKIASTSNQSFD
ncbi:MAG: M23 family metallopeptidase [Chitinophagaceae bacterium]|nr:M23 family metallopeptidase [Chitinophagaceae bacterium]